MTRTLLRQAEADTAATRNDAEGTLEYSGEMALLLRHFVTLLAMQYRRAPLPISPSFLKVCLRHGFPGGVGELESMARRYLFWGDEGLALSELGTQADASRIPGPALPMAGRMDGSSSGGA